MNRGESTVTGEDGGHTVVVPVTWVIVVPFLVLT